MLQSSGGDVALYGLSRLFINGSSKIFLVSIKRVCEFFPSEGRVEVRLLLLHYLFYFIE